MLLKTTLLASFQSSEQIRKGLFFRILVLSLNSILIISLIIDCIELPDLIIRWITVIVLLLLMSLVLLYLNKNGHTKLSSVLFVSFFMALILGLAWTAGGVKALSFLYLPVVLFVAGLLLNQRATIVTAVVGVGGGLFLLISDHYGILPVSLVHYDNFETWTNLSVVVGLLALLQYLTVDNLNKALQNAQQELDLRKKTEDILQIREIFFKSIFENANDAIFIMKDGLFIECNIKTLKMFGCEANQIINKPPHYFSPQYQEDGSLSETKAFYFIQQAQEGIPQRFEWIHCRLDGESFYADVSLSRLVVNDEVLLQAIVRDISDRKKSERIIRENEQRIRAIFDLSFGFIGLLSTEGILLEANNTSIDFAGIKSKDVLGKPFWDTPWWNHSVEMQQKLKEAILAAGNGKTVKFEATHPDPEGKIRTIDFSLKPVKDETGKVVMLIPEGRDITDHKMFEKQLYNSVLLTEEKEKEHFAKELHDGLGPILSTCKIYLSHLNNKLLSDTDLSEAAAQTLKLLDDGLMSIKEISNNLSPHILKNYGLIQAIKSFINNIKLVSKVDFVFKCASFKRLNDVVEFSIYRILTELVNNSLKHSEAENIGIFIEQTGETFKVVYTDNGKGFDYNKIRDQKKGFGLLNMENRIKKLDGEFLYNTSAGNGVKVQILLNLNYL